MNKRAEVISIPLSHQIITLDIPPLSVFLAVSTENSEIALWYYKEVQDHFLLSIFQFPERKDLSHSDYADSLFFNYSSYTSNLDSAIPDKHYSLITDREIIERLQETFFSLEPTSMISLFYCLFSIMWVKSISFYNFIMIIEEKKRLSKEWVEEFSYRERKLNVIIENDEKMFRKLLDLTYRFSQLKTDYIR